MKLLTAILLIIPTTLSFGQKQAGGQVSPQATYHVLVARAAEERQEWELAEKSYLRAIKLAPAWAEVFVNLAVVYNRQGKTDEAIKMLKRALQLKPRLTSAQLNLGVTYFKAAR